MNHDPRWAYFGLTVFALFLKNLAVLLVLAYERFWRQTGLDTPEDVTFVRRVTGPRENPTENRERVDRAKSILQNDTENLPLFLFTVVAYIQLDCWPTGLQVYLPLFVLARVAHAVSYLRGVQPWRHLAYQLGMWITFFMLLHVGGKAWGYLFV